MGYVNHEEFLVLSTHLPLSLHICVSEWGQHWFRWCLVTYSAPSHYLNQCWVIVNWTLGDKLQWYFNQNTKPFIHEKEFKLSSVKRRPFCPGGDELTWYSVMCLSLTMPSNEWQWLDLNTGHQDNSPSNDHQSAMPYSTSNASNNTFALNPIHSLPWHIVSIL